MAACSSMGAPSIVDSSDDSIHSNNTIQIDGGTLTLASGDDGIHADATVEFNGGQIDISTSYEGIEANSITLRDGTVHIVSSDDGHERSGQRHRVGDCRQRDGRFSHRRLRMGPGSGRWLR